MTSVNCGRQLNNTMCKETALIFSFQAGTTKTVESLYFPKTVLNCRRQLYNTMFKETAIIFSFQAGTKQVLPNQDMLLLGKRTWIYSF